MTQMAVALCDPINYAILTTQLVIGAGLSLLLTMQMDKWGAWLHITSSTQQNAGAAANQGSCHCNDPKSGWGNSLKGAMQAVEGSEDQQWQQPKTYAARADNPAGEQCAHNALESQQLTSCEQQHKDDNGYDCSSSHAFNDTATALHSLLDKEAATEHREVLSDTVTTTHGNCNSEDTVVTSRLEPAHAIVQAHNNTPLSSEFECGTADTVIPDSVTPHPQVSAQQQSTVLVKALGVTAASAWLQDTMACMTAAGEGYALVVLPAACMHIHPVCCTSPTLHQNPACALWCFTSMFHQRIACYRHSWASKSIL